MNGVENQHRQLDYPLRLDWGPPGAAAIAVDCDVAVVVDVLSFTTTLTVAADRDIAVYPCPWRDDEAARLAEERNATLAVGRSMAREYGDVSLSPVSVRNASHVGRLVLPSPNGSAICFQLAETAEAVVGASLRNRRAVADWLHGRRAANPTLRVSVVAAGERWPDGSLRPAVEDLWGAGALISLLLHAGWSEVSPEAHSASAAFLGLPDDIGASLRGCASGRELIARGYADDVDIAAEDGLSASVPILRDGAFIPTP